MDRPATDSGSAATIPRPALPPLPPAIQAQQGAAAATEASVVPAPVVSAAVVAAVAAAPVAKAVDVDAVLSQIKRPDLPPTPPELLPLVEQAPAPASTGAAAAIPAAEPAPPTLANEPTAGTFAPAEEASVPLEDANGATSASIDFPNVAAPVAPASDAPSDSVEQAPTPPVDKPTPSPTPQDAKAQTSSKQGGGSSLVKPLLAAAVALALLGGLVWFGLGLLNSTTIVSDLQTGQCVENFFETGEDGGFVEIFAVSTVDCAQPHAYEVFAVNEALFTSDIYPGIGESFATGQDYCLEQYETFIGGGAENLTTWDVWTFVPPENSWSDERRVHCLVGDFAETTPITGTLQGAAG